MPIKNMSSTETLVMKCIWDYLEDVPLQDLIEKVNKEYGKDYKRSTIVTLLSRLEEKGYLSTYRKGRFSYVHAIESEENHKKKLAQQDTDSWFDGKASNFLSALFETRNISKEEADEIRELLDELDK